MTLAIVDLPRPPRPPAKVRPSPVRLASSAQPSPYSDAKPANSRTPKPHRAPPMSLATVLEAWRAEGPLVHEPTGLERLDNLTGGGPVYGTRWYLIGSPDAGKTAFLTQLADAFAGRGIAVGMLAIDEDPGDVATRFFQRRGLTRAECEHREPLVLRDAQDRIGGDLPLRFYDASWTIEAAALDLATWARARGSRACLTVDSIQTARCEAELGAASVREAVTARVQAIREVATRHRLIVVATSEMGRHGYRTIEAAENTDDLASAKESGAIEYSARVLLALRSVAGEPDLLELRIAKNKHGPRTEAIGLKIDRRLQQLTETDAPEKLDPLVERDEARDSRARARCVQAAAAAVHVLLKVPGMGRAELTGALRAEIGACSADLANAAMHTLGAAVVRLEGPKRRQFLFLDGSKLPEEVLAALPLEVRPAATTARPPEVAPGEGSPVAMVARLAPVRNGKTPSQEGSVSDTERDDEDAEGRRGVSC